jgi:hypothetical protein
MFIKPERLNLLIHDIEITPYLKHGVTGPMYGESCIVDGRIEPSTEKLTDTDGREFVSRAFLILKAGERPTLQSKIRWRVKGTEQWSGPYLLKIIEPIFDFVENHVEGYLI